VDINTCSLLRKRAAAALSLFLLACLLGFRIKETRLEKRKSLTDFFAATFFFATVRRGDYLTVFSVGATWS